MKKIFILLTSMFLLVGCIESVLTIGMGNSSGKVVQSSLQSAASYGVKKTTGRTPFGHALNYAKKNKASEKKDSCSSFEDKKEKEICLMLEKRIISKQKKTQEPISSLQSSINARSKIKYLD